MDSNSNDGWQTVKRREPPSFYQKKKLEKNKKEKEQSEIQYKMMMDAFYEDQKVKPKLPSKKKVEEFVKPISTTNINTVKPTSNNGDEIGAYKLNTISVEQRTRLQKTRTLKGLTRKELANLCNVSIQVLTDYENGKGSYDCNIYNRLIQKMNSLPDKKQE